MSAALRLSPAAESPWREPVWGEVIHDHAGRFLDRLADGEPVTFQTFDDAKQGRRHLARTLHGTLEKRGRELVQLNEAGAGIYVAVNMMDGHGRRNANVLAVRALFLDLDGAPLDPVRAASPHPHIINETSPGRYHCFWILEECAPDPERFAEIQGALARRFGGDPRDKDLARVCRVPGFFHRKGKEYLSRLLIEHRAPPYRIAAVVAGLGLRAEKAPPRPTPAPRGGGALPGNLSAYGGKALKDAAQRIGTAPAGQQHFTLNRECFSIGQLVAGGLLPEGAARQALLCAGSQMTSYDSRRRWTPAEIDRQVMTAFNDGLQKPRGGSND